MAKQKWITVQIPEGSRPHEVIQKGGNGPAWKALDKNLKEQQKTKQEKVDNEFNKFMNFTEELYPGSKRKLEMLSPIIFKTILRIKSDEFFENFEDISDEFYNELKENLNNDI